MERLKVTYLNLTRSCLQKVQPTKTEQNMEVEHEPFAEVHSLKTNICPENWSSQEEN